MAVRAIFWTLSAIFWPLSLPPHIAIAARAGPQSRKSWSHIESFKRLRRVPLDPPAGGCRMGWNQFEKLKKKKEKSVRNRKTSLFSLASPTHLHVTRVLPYAGPMRLNH